MGGDFGVHPKIDLKRLPPLKALRGFEAATRHQSIRGAADELCLTHPAVSHQVQLIEKALGVTLFMHDGRNVVSTDEGKILYPYVRSAFESLIEGVTAVRRHALDLPLIVQTYVTASIRWLAPRMPQFLQQHPGVRLTLRTCAAEWEFDNLHADVGLIYCPELPDPERYHWLPLFDYTLLPVCSPAMRARLPAEVTPAMLVDMPLLRIYTEDLNWEDWFGAAGIDFHASPVHPRVDTLAVALEIALRGEGIALVNGPFATQDLAEGRLVVPVDQMAVCPGSWGLICRQAVKNDLPVRTFMNWVAAHAN